MKMSNHAAKRMQQRGIPKEALEILEAFGSNRPQKGGSNVLYLSKAQAKQIRSKVRKLNQWLDRSQKLYAVISDDGTCITTGHQYGKGLTS